MHCVSASLGQDCARTDSVHYSPGEFALSYPFVIWTVQRTGGTSLADLLMKMSEHQGAEHEPFNWEGYKSRQFGHVSRHWAETKDAKVLTATLREILAARHLIKHCYELHPFPFNARLMRTAAETDYRHILLLRRDDLSRLASKFIAEANGTWFKDYAAEVYAGIATRQRTLAPLPVDEVVHQYKYYQKMTARLRALFAEHAVEMREIWYEDIYVGSRETRLLNLDSLFEYLGFSTETIEAHRADIEEKIFHGGQNTGNILRFVPNLTDVRKAIGLPEPNEEKNMDLESGDQANDPSQPEFPIFADDIFTAENGFVAENGLGYDPKELHRLNARYRAFFRPNLDAIAGKAVLDLGSYDGRWSFAALEGGAARVVGVERRQDFIDRWRFIGQGGMRDRAQFICDDVFEALSKLSSSGERFDVILCLGLLYEIVDHHRLLKLMAALGPELVILDTNLIDSNEAIIRVKAADGKRNVPLSGIPSRKTLELLANDLGYEIRYEDWNPEGFAQRDGLNDYFTTNKAGVRRYSCYLSKAFSPL